ncbi:hypothetical protein ANCCAN_24652 [Ancylostoma caninum]|uniref:Uncharacterized protein n=1 Tax=Ancylostoma caninum TaxID=29170 RepID=A0A368FBQ8_ANCCA|nr:hypothetical protein ANCCAN_24652 [Ancylostoma caninum]
MTLLSAQNAQVVSPPGVVAPVECDEIQCAPFFVCVKRPVTCLSSVCPPMSTVPLCVPGDSAACSRLACTATQKCIYQETSCSQAQCPPVATCVPATPHNYPVAPPGGPPTQGGYLTAPISIPSPGGPSRSGPSPVGSYPLPPPGVPASQLGTTDGGPPPVQPLPSGVQRPASPKQGVSPARPLGYTLPPSSQRGGACAGVKCFVGFVCIADSKNTPQCVPPVIAKQISERQTPNTAGNIGIGIVGKSAYVIPKEQHITAQSEERRWPARILSPPDNG